MLYDFEVESCSRQFSLCLFIIFLHDYTLPFDIHVRIKKTLQMKTYGKLSKCFMTAKAKKIMKINVN